MKHSVIFSFALIFSAAAVAETKAPTAADQALIVAAGQGEVAVIQALIVNGASLQAQDETHGWTALMAATHADQVDAARVLIEAGSDVNARDKLNDSPYLYAGAEGKLAILRLTLAHGADLKSTNRFNGNAIIPASEKGHLETVQELLKTSIDVNHVNRPGWTALLEVTLKKRGPVYTEIVRALLAGGANPNLADKQGVTPLAHAEKNGNVEMAALIRAAGGK